MSKDYKNSTFRELLDKLQQESWQLELLISGFAIFGLFSSTSAIQTNLEAANYDSSVYFVLLWFSIKVCCWILISNLLIHVVLRGLWIGALGLRYVSGDIDYDELNYSQKFTKFLSKKIGSFDKYIATLENYCSVLFAISFLLIFYFIACLAFIVAILMTVFVFLDNDLNGWMEQVATVTGAALIIFILLGALLTFVDFIFQGFLKKKKWISRIYFPLYRVFSFITLSFLYRPLVYNFLDNRFGRRLSAILVPLYVGILFLSSYYYQESNYLSVNRSSSKNYANPGNYEDLLIENSNFIETATIQSKIITDPYVKIFMIFDERIEEELFDYNSKLKPLKDLRGYKSEITISRNNTTRKQRRKRDSLRAEYYKTFNDIHTIYIDSLKYDAPFLATTNKNKKLGFETYLDIKNLTSGKHLLKIERKRKRKKDTVNFTLVQIPFWNFKTN